MPSPARVAAYRALMAIELGRADLPTALADTRAALADSRDRTLAAEIATGTLRWQGQLDALIGHFGRRPPGRLDREVLVVLRLSAYQLVHLTRVPAAAATDDAVALVRRARKSSAAGFVNAVLRALGRRRHALPLPAVPSPDVLSRLPADAQARTAALDYLSVTLSHPRWLVERWLDRYGFAATRRWAELDNTPAPLTLRANTLKVSAPELAARLRLYDVQTTPAPYAPHGLIVTRGNPLRTPLADSGLFVLQDEASQLVAELAAAAPGERVLDCCASPGGKTTALAAAMAGSGLVVAADLRPRRLELLRQAVEASGARIRLVRFDARLPLPFEGAPFDLVLLDAPCSGLGTIRRDPEIRWRRRPDDLVRLAAAQTQMIDQASAVVRRGGRLVYATCSSEPEENDAVVSAFLRRRPTFALEPTARGRAAPGLAAVTDADGALRTSPARHGLDAFYSVVLRRLL